MAVTLLTLADGHVSLEFETSDLPRVAAAIRSRFGGFAFRRDIASAECRFGGCSFTFENEWDDPCLISGSAEGDEVLRALAALINLERKRGK